MKILITHYLLAIFAFLAISCGQKQSYQVVIIGGGTSGTAAGLQSARMGAKSLIVEEFEWLGGMLTSSGVSATDGNYRLRGGLWGEFRDSLEAHYGGADALKTGWVSNVLFEPKVGNRIFQNMAAAEKNLTVWYDSKPTKISREDGIWHIQIDRGGEIIEIQTNVLIDATELGDIASDLGITYDIGMDSAAQTGEDIAPAVANDIVQDLTMVMVLKDYGRDMTIERPADYDPSLFAGCCDNDLCINPKEPDRVWSREKMITYGRLPNQKYMINWPIEGNDFYVNMVDMTTQQRADAVSKAKSFSRCFLYFLQKELGFSTLSIDDDQFPTPDGLPFMPYHRESRRIHGKVRFTLTDITSPYRNNLYRTAIGVGDYPVDQHHARYSGWGDLPNLYFHPIPSYGLPLGVLIPAKGGGLIVAEKSISVTNIVNGSSRLQPVVLQIGQAAGVLAALAVEGRCDVAEVSPRSVQKAILASGGYLLPYLDLPASDPRFCAMQRIGATGIMRSRGANIGWENQTWFDGDKTISQSELRDGMLLLYGGVKPSEELTPVTAQSLAQMLFEATSTPASQLLERIARLGIEPSDRPLTRLECAIIIDSLLDPFHTFDVDINGDYIKPPVSALK